MTEVTKPRVLIIGGYGVFGGRLARRLARHSDLEVLVAGRNLALAEKHCRDYGGTPLRLDLREDLKATLATLRPTIVIDAAGPFQHYEVASYRVARAAMAVGAHYLDLADDTAFVAGISALEGEAVSAGVVVLSGCSSVPAISAAVTTALVNDITDLHSIESCILPGNRAPRGESVVSAILAQVGRPIKFWCDRQWSETFAWCNVKSIQPAIPGQVALPKRWLSPIGAPDLELFPTHFKARTVRFQAGLELAIMHLGLAAIAWLVRLRVMQSARPMTRPLLWIASRLEPFGSDRGAMTVDVVGRTDQGKGVHRCWTLIAEAGDGPEIPPTPAYLLARRLCTAPQSVPAGARACISDLTLQDIEAGLSEFDITTHQQSETVEPLFWRALQHDYERLPAALRTLHDVLGERVFLGTSTVQRGSGLLSRLIGWSMGFPPASEELPVRVAMRPVANGETWQRHFGRHRFHSHLSYREGARLGEIWERFGPLYCRLNLYRANGALHFPVTAVRLFGIIPLPSFLVPISDTREYVDDQGRACFDVSISHPLAGFIVRYRGWLLAAASNPGA